MESYSRKSKLNFMWFCISCVCVSPQCSIDGGVYRSNSTVCLSAPEQPATAAVRTALSHTAVQPHQVRHTVPRHTDSMASGAGLGRRAVPGDEGSLKQLPRHSPMLGCKYRIPVKLARSVKLEVFGVCRWLLGQAPSGSAAGLIPALETAFTATHQGRGE